MIGEVSRRLFLGRSLAASTGAALTFGFEEKCLAARSEDGENVVDESASPSLGAGEMPMGKIKDLSISRLICGGNLISGIAHSRDLIYVSALLRKYFTDEKILETLEICEGNGINTAILRYDDRTLRIIRRYWKERGGKMHWIAQIKPKPDDLTKDADAAIEIGAEGVYVQGECGDSFFKNGNIDILGKFVEHAGEQHVLAGSGAHMIDVIIACEKAGISPDFYMKTFNAKNYWSAGPVERHDSVWEETPEQTLEFM